METGKIRSWWVKSVIVTLALFLLFIPTVKVHAAGTSGKCGDNLTWSLSADGTVLTISGSGKMTDYSYGTYDGGVIPPWSEYSYAGNSKITKVILPNGISNIGKCAFYSCSSLSSINIPNTVKSIGDYSFNNCSSLSSLTIPNSVMSIGSYAFYYCSNLSSITIPNSVTSISSSAFSGCSSLSSVTIPNSVTSIGDSAFYNCSSLSSVTIPNSVTSIGSSAFYGCSSLSSVTIPNSVTSIGSYAFSGCSSLSGVTIPNSITSIGYNMLNGCSSLRSVTIPDSVTSIESRAFYDCSNLREISIPNSVTSIGYNAFENCTSLVSCKALGVKSIGGSAFSGCTNLTEVAFSEELNYIEADAFSGCKKLRTIGNWSVDNNMTTITSKAFENASALSELYVPRKVTAIKDYAFLGCNSLKKVGIPIVCTTIETGAYRNCPITDVYYEGTKAQWDAISIGSYNESLTNATIHYESFDVYKYNGSYRNLEWEYIGGKYYWYEDNVRQGTSSDSKCFSYDGTLRGREIYDPKSDGWYWLDVNAVGAKAVGKEVFMPYVYQDEKNWSATEIMNNAQASNASADGNYERAELAAQVQKAIQNGTGKWVRYDSNGKMLKGWVKIEGTLAELYPDQAGNVYYYDRKTGLMAKGVTVIGGKTYNFDEVTGVLK